MLAGVSWTRDVVMRHLAGAGVGNSLTSDQVRRHGLNASPILRWGSDLWGKRGAGQMQTPRTLLFFDSMLRDPQPFDRQVDDLPPLGYSCRGGREIALAVRAALDCIEQDRVRCFYLMQGMALVPRDRKSVV